MFKLNSKKIIVTVFMMFTSLCLHAEVTVTDYLGREVSLASPAKRIVALAPHIVENIASAGGLKRIVGAVDYCDYPAQAKAIPRVGAISQFSLEAIVSLRPDLVVVWMSTKGSEVLTKLEKLGIKTYANDPKTLEDIARSIRDYGVLMDTSDTAEKAVRKLEHDLISIQQKTGYFTDMKPPSVFYQVWHDPLQTLNGKHIISDVIRRCGGINAFAELPVLAPKLSVESVIAENPKIIVASGMGEARPDWLDQWRKYPMISAVQNNQLHFIPPDLIQRHTLRMLDGAQMMCEFIWEYQRTLVESELN